MSTSAIPTHFPSASADGWDKTLRFLVDKPLAIAGIVIGAFVVNKLARRLVKLTVRRLGLRRVRRGPGLLRRHTPSSLLDTAQLLSQRAHQRIEAMAAGLAGATSFIVWFVAALLVLHVLGIRIATLLTTAGLFGLALAFGSQSAIKDVVSGVFILVEDQFGVGDVVDVGEANGTVEAVTLRASRIRSADGTLWHVPNGQIARVGNMTQHWSRSLLDVKIAYDADVERARAAMKQAADAVWQADDAVLEEPEVVGVTSLGPGGVTIRLVAKTKPLEQWRISRRLRERIKEEFDHEGIELPEAMLWTASDEAGEGQRPEAVAR